MFTIANARQKKPLKHRPGEIVEAYVKEVSIVDRPANLTPFIYIKSLEETNQMDDEIVEILKEMGVYEEPPKTESKETPDLEPDVLDVIQKTAEAFESIQNLSKADEETQTVDAELEKAGVKKDVQRPALLKLLDSLNQKIGDYLTKAGYDKKEKVSMTKSDSEQPEASEAPEIKDGEESQLNEEQVKALIEKSVNEALAKAKEENAPAAPSAEQEAEASELNKSLDNIEERVNTLANQVTEKAEENAELKKSHEAEKTELEKRHDQVQVEQNERIEKLTKTLGSLEGLFAIRSGNSTLVNEGGGPPPKEPTEIEKQKNIWSDTPVASFAQEVRSKQ